MHLDPIQLRVLGSLIEKEIATPENYPLSLNALINACNQRSSRDPVLDLTEDEVRQALHILEDLLLVTTVHDARVPKYEHRIRTVLNLRRDETAILCLLMLRGPQTSGELRSRSDRLYTFDDLASVQSTLDRLANRPATTESGGEAPTGSLTIMLPRQPGSRESRYAHLLGDQNHSATRQEPAATSENLRPDNSDPATNQRLAQMEVEIAALTTALRDLQSRVNLLESNR
ncbi:MAG: YceH family protein [Edaphobacter sp.]